MGELTSLRLSSLSVSQVCVPLYVGRVSLPPFPGSSYLKSLGGADLRRVALGDWGVWSVV